MPTVFKIINKHTGYFSKGGAGKITATNEYRWSKTGKVWSTLGHVKQHLAQTEYENGVAEVIEFEMKIMSMTPVENFKPKK